MKDLSPHTRSVADPPQREDTVKKGSKEDLESYGFIAVEDYESATKAFGEGLALYPPGMPKKRAQETRESE